jgi:hypothetical protein
VNGHELLRIARDRYPEVEWKSTPEGLRGTDRAKGVRVLRYVRGDPPEIVIERARGHLRRAKRMGASGSPGC